MSKKPTFTRTTISVPAEIKRRMDKVAESVNWSAIASQAFEQKLAEIATRKEKKDMGDVIQRLRESNRRSNDKLFDDGHFAGEVWAKNDAEAAELRNLKTWCDSCGRDWERVWTDENASKAYSGGEQLVFAIRPEHDGISAAAVDFWESVVGDDKRWEEDRFSYGFAEGALSVWNRVKSQI